MLETEYSGKYNRNNRGKWKNLSHHFRKKNSRKKY